MGMHDGGAMRSTSTSADNPPPSITTLSMKHSNHGSALDSHASVSLIAAIGKTGIVITTFVIDVRDSKKDLERVMLELTSLRMSLVTLEEDCKSSNINISTQLCENLTTVLGNCTIGVAEIEKLLVKLLDGKRKRMIQWAFTGKSDMNHLRSSLEAHKLSLNFALELMQ
jgi:hypothetical protein